MGRGAIRSRRKVSAAANGLQAWKILEDLTNHVDLVLTEVVMPYLSGIGLLSKIMSHKTCRNIPVIMMSSNDSMGIVFKCLSKGAVDFLVKPVRKNELKNLWQHVWRRCHSSSGSGSGSESGNQTQSSSEQQNANNADYCDSEDDDNESIKLNTRDGSDNGSGTQSSYTKQSVGIDSRQAISPSDPLTDPPNSTCAQVLQPNSEIFSKELGNMAMDRSCQAQNESTDESTGKDLGIEISRNSNMQCESNPTEIKNEGVVGVDPSNTFEEPTVHAADLIAPIAGNKDTQQAAGVTNAPSDSSNISKSRDDIYQGFIDSSLKRLRSTGENAISTQDSRNGLKHSDSSAFTRYHNSATSNKPLSGCGGSCSPFDNGSEAWKMELTHNMLSKSNAPFEHGSNGSRSNNNDLVSTTKNVITDAPTQIGASATTQDTQRKTDRCSSIKNMMEAKTLQCGPSNVFAKPLGGTATKHSLHGSNSGSNFGSNGQNGGSTAVNAGGIDMESANGIVGGDNGSGSGRGSGSGTDQNQLTQREAALNKFRQKRKERNFGKKVRYQSRKRLAEQRPRLHGQFVRQNMHGQTSKDTE
ncbi:Two-component response regulator-like PRR73 [Ananas comosus]|uniref:Two-component response regulator-like PRR73 n=1 Tax=Ananas comosus TaxID=4615 RepID=A0A199UDB9_ANACO|nr:Two-component response regulator-like PRR73 [Ananas comosus]